MGIRTDTGFGDSDLCGLVIAGSILPPQEGPLATAHPRYTPVKPVRISAVIPTYNRAQLVVRAIESALDQERPPDEIIVVDDGSIDDTAEHISRFGTAVRFLQKENGGGAAARNEGVRAARNEWVAFLDSDDVWEPHHLQRMEAAIQATRGAANLYFSDTVLAPHDGPRESVWQAGEFAPQEDYKLTADGTTWSLLSMQPMMLQSSVFSTDAYLRVGGLRESLVRRHDTHLFFLISIGKTVCAVKGCGSVMTADDSSETRLTIGHDPKSQVYWESTVDMYSDILRRLPNLSRSNRKLLKKREATGHRCLARHAFHDRRMLEFTKRIWLGARLDPVGLFNPILKRFQTQPAIQESR